ncbi:MAG: hypothetical protein ACERKZ_16395 [Lachnotalea sp.]
MLLKLKHLYNTTANYPRLQKERQEALRTWMSMAGNFLLAICKFIMGCAAGSGFLCVSALYTCLMGVAKRQYISYMSGEDKNLTLIHQSFLRIGMAVLFAGIVYGVYMGRLILYPRKADFHISVGILIALFCFIDIGIAAYSLIKIPTCKVDNLLLIGKRLASLAFALPAIVMAQIVINSFANGKNLSNYDGIFGVVMGVIIVGIGLGMMCYAKHYLDRMDCHATDSIK